MNTLFITFTLTINFTCINTLYIIHLFLSIIFPYTDVNNITFLKKWLKNCSLRKDQDGRVEGYGAYFVS